MLKRSWRRDFDFSLFIVTIILCVVGVLVIYSATHHAQSMALKNIYQKQLLWIGLGVAVLFLTAAVSLRIFQAFSYIIYGICLILLILVLFFPAPALAARRWFVFGPFWFQPSELAKVATVMAIANFLANRERSLERIRDILIPFLLVAFPAALVAKEPNLATALVFCALVFPMLFWAGVKPVQLLLILSPIINIICALPVLKNNWIFWTIFMLGLFAILYVSKTRLLTALSVVGANLAVGIMTTNLWGRLHEYQRERILAFFDPGRDPLGAGYQAIQSKVAIGSGGFFGKGFLEGTQTKLAFLPGQHTDFVFSVIGEEFGFIGSILVLSLILFLLIRGIKIASEAKSQFASLTAVGIVSVLTFYVLVNVGMSLGMIPVAGLPLPFISYGGSSLLINMMMVGLLLNIGMRKQEY